MGEDGHFYSSTNCGIFKFDREGNSYIRLTTSRWKDGGLAADSNGNVYVGDVANNQIRKFDSFGNELIAWSTSGTVDNEFVSPRKLVLDIDEKLYVFDPDSRLIQEYELDGIQLAEWSIPDSGAEESVLNNALALDPTGNIYLLEGNHVLLVDTEGNLLSKWGGNGKGAGQFSKAADLSLDSVGNLYVLDANRVQKFVPVDQSEPSAISLASGQNQAFTGLRSGRYTFTVLTPNAWDELNIECNNWTGPIQIADGLGVELNGQDIRCAFIDVAESVGDRPTTTLILPPTPTPLPTLIPTSTVTPTPEALLPNPASTLTPVPQPTSGLTSTATPLSTAEEQPILTGTLTSVPTSTYSTTPLMTATPIPQMPSATSIVMTPTQPPSTPASTGSQGKGNRVFMPIVGN